MALFRLAPGIRPRNRVFFRNLKGELVESKPAHERGSRNSKKQYVPVFVGFLSRPLNRHNPSHLLSLS
jgi:hypothetical protein